MRESAARGRKVVALDTAAAVGRLDGFVIDPATARVVALRLRGTRNRATALPWPSLHGFGDDAITVSNADLIVQPGPELVELMGKAGAVLRKRVLSSAGFALGEVRDVDIDTGTGAVVSLILADTTISGRRMLGAGSYAVVVRA